MDEKFNVKNFSQLQNLSTEKINKLANDLIILFEKIYEGECKNETECVKVFIDIYKKNPRPNITWNDLLDDNFCKKNENKYVSSLFEDLTEVKDINNFLLDFNISSEKTIKELKNKSKLTRICDYFGLIVTWIIYTTGYMVMKTKDLELTWDKERIPSIKFVNHNLKIVPYVQAYMNNGELQFRGSKNIIAVMFENPELKLFYVNLNTGKRTDLTR